MEIRVFYGKAMFYTCFYAKFSIIHIVSPWELCPFLFFPVFAYLKAISPAAISKTLLEKNVEEMSEIHWENICYQYFCTDSSSLVIVSHKNSVLFCLFNTCSLKRLITCNSNNSVPTVIIIGTTCILWQSNVLNVFLRWN